MDVIIICGIFVLIYLLAILGQIATGVKFVGLLTIALSVAIFIYGGLVFFSYQNDTWYLPSEFVVGVYSNGVKDVIDPTPSIYAIATSVVGVIVGSATVFSSQFIDL